MLGPRLLFRVPGWNIQLGFRGTDGRDCGGKSAKERRVLFRIRISKTDHGATVFKSAIVLLLPPKSLNIMALLSDFFATRLQCYRSIFATTAAGLSSISRT